MTTAPRSPRPSLGLVAFLILAMTLPTLAAVCYFVWLDGHAAATLVYGGSKIVQFSLPLLALLLFGELRPQRSAAIWKSLPSIARWSHTRSLLVGLGSGLALVLGSLGCYWLLAGSRLLAVVRDEVAVKLVDFEIASPMSYITFSVFLALVHSALEEYYWRWFVFGVLARYIPTKSAIVLSSLAFMSHHVVIVSQYVLPSSNYAWWIIACLSVAFSGGLWCWLYHRGGRLIGPWISHVAADLVVLGLGYDLIFG